MYNLSPLLKVSRQENQRVTTLTQKQPLRTSHSQEEGCRHHVTHSFEQSSHVTYNPNRYDLCAWYSTWKRGGCSGFVIKCGCGTYTRYISQHYIAGKIQ